MGALGVRGRADQGTGTICVGYPGRRWLQTSKNPITCANMSTTARIEGASKRLAPHSRALDVMLTSLERLQSSPNTEKYRKVNVDVLNRAIDKAPGATDLLCAVGYEYIYGHLVLQWYREAPVAEAIAALKRARGSISYKQSSDQAEAARRIAVEEAAEREAARMRRARYEALVPKEPDLRESEATSCTVAAASPPWPPSLSASASLPSLPLPSGRQHPRRRRRATRQPPLRRRAHASRPCQLGAVARALAQRLDQADQHHAGGDRARPRALP